MPNGLLLLLASSSDRCLRHFLCLPIYLVYLTIHLLISQHPKDGHSEYRNQSAEEATDEELQNIYPINDSYSSLVRNIQSPLPPACLKKDPLFDTCSGGVA